MNGTCHTKWCISVNPNNAKILLYKPWRPKGFLQFETIINVLVSSLRFIWVPMLWVYDHYKCLILLVRGFTLDFRIWRLKASDSAYRRQHLTFIDVRLWRLKSTLTFQGLSLSSHAKRLSEVDKMSAMDYYSRWQISTERKPTPLSLWTFLPHQFSAEVFRESICHSSIVKADTCFAPICLMFRHPLRAKVLYQIHSMQRYVELFTETLTLHYKFGISSSCALIL